MILLAGAALYIRGLDELNNTRGGWQSERLLTGTVVLPAASYGDADKIASFHRLTLERLQSVPGVASVSISSFTPFFNWADVRKYLVEGRELPQPGHEPAAVVNSISPLYFDTYQTRVLAGRAFNERDTLTSPKVFIISQAMATGTVWERKPDRSPRRSNRHRQSAMGRNCRRRGRHKNGHAGPRPGNLPTLPAHGSGAAALQRDRRAHHRRRAFTLVPAIRNVMTELDPDLPVRQLQAADVTIDRANYQSAVLRDMLAAFAVLGLGLASLGIYGVIARTMAQRAGEFAIRFALGACVRGHHPHRPDFRRETGADRISPRSARCAGRFPTPCRQ